MDAQTAHRSSAQGIVKHENGLYFNKIRLSWEPKIGRLHASPDEIGPPGPSPEGLPLGYSGRRDDL